MKQPHILLAEDDADDRVFFNKALKLSSIKCQLTMVTDGERLMTYLSEHDNGLPDFIVLDLNMMKKNGTECLQEIKNINRLTNIPVVIYSTNLHTEIADSLYLSGAQYYIKKTDPIQMSIILKELVSILFQKKVQQPLRQSFVLNSKNLFLLKEVES